MYPCATRRALNWTSIFFLNTRFESSRRIFGCISLLFGFYSQPLVYCVLELILSGHAPAFKLLWIFIMPCFLKMLWFAVFWLHHTKVSALLVYKCLYLWCIFYHNILELVIDVVKRISIVWRIQFIDLSNDIFIYVFIMILFFLFCKRNDLDAIDGNLYAPPPPPRILLGLNLWLIFYVFSLEFSLDRTNFYVIPIIGIVFILLDISACLGILFSWYLLYVVFLSIWHNVLAGYVLCVDSTCDMYRHYNSAHNLGTWMHLIDLTVLIVP